MLPYDKIIALLIVTLAACTSANESLNFETAPRLAPLVKKKDAITGRYMVTLVDDTKTSVTALAAELTKTYGGEIRHVYQFEGEGGKGFSVSGMQAARAQALARDHRVSLVEEVARATRAWGHLSGDKVGLDLLDQRELPLDGRLRSSADGTGVHVYVLDDGIQQIPSEFEIVITHDIYAPSGPVPAPYGNHGTAMAGHIASKSYGIAPKAKLVDVRVFNGNSIANGEDDIVKGLNWVVDHARLPGVVNISLEVITSSTTGRLQGALTTALNKGLLVVAAAGNQGVNVNDSNVLPASLPGVLTVGAATRNFNSNTLRWTRWVDAPLAGSNYGPAVAIFAPAAGMPTLDLSGMKTSAISGTSTAAAIVSGVAALTFEALAARPYFVPQVVLPLTLFDTGNSAGTGSFAARRDFVRDTILAHATKGRIADLQGSADRFIFSETWPIPLHGSPHRSDTLLSVSSKPGTKVLYAAIGEFEGRFEDLDLGVSGAPVALKYDIDTKTETRVGRISSGGCTDVFDPGGNRIDPGGNRIWLACTRRNGSMQEGVIVAVDKTTGMNSIEQAVGTDLFPSNCASNNSIARSLAVNSGALVVVGEAWCDNGPRHAFAQRISTESSPQINLRPIVLAPSSVASAAYAVAFNPTNQEVLVVGYEINSVGKRRAKVWHIVSNQSTFMNVGNNWLAVEPSAAYAVAVDSTDGSFYVSATLERDGDKLAWVMQLNSQHQKLWEYPLSGALVQGLGALKDGVLVAGHSNRYLPHWPRPDSSQPSMSPGAKLLGDSAFLLRLDRNGTYRWSRGLSGWKVMGLRLSGEGETTKDNVVATVVGLSCSRPVIGICNAQRSSFLESFVVR